MARSPPGFNFHALRSLHSRSCCLPNKLEVAGREETFNVKHDFCNILKWLNYCTSTDFSWLVFWWLFLSFLIQLHRSGSYHRLDCTAISSRVLRNSDISYKEDTTAQQIQKQIYTHVSNRGTTTCWINAISLTYLSFLRQICFDIDLSSTRQRG